MAQHPKVEYIRMYTDGSAARELQVAAPVEKVRFAHTKKKKKILLYVDPIAAAGVVMAVIMLAVMLVSTINLCSIQQENIVLENYVTRLRTENAALRTEYEAGIDIAKVERAALAMGMVPDAQVRHVTLHVEQPQSQEPAGVWEQFCAFLTGLFA